MADETHNNSNSGIRLDKITTRTGDRGMTSLPGRSRPKHAPEFSAIGDLDELGAFIGWAVTALQNPEMVDDLRTVQSHLFEIGSLIASGKGSLGFEKEINWLEDWHERLNEQLPPLNSFILAGGAESAARLQVARAVCRRAERSYWKLHEELPPSDEAKPLFVQAGVYLNRLSDLLFTLARYRNALDGETEPNWVPR